MYVNTLNSYTPMELEAVNLWNFRDITEDELKEKFTESADSLTIKESLNHTCSISNISKFYSRYVPDVFKKTFKDLGYEKCIMLYNLVTAEEQHNETTEDFESKLIKAIQEDEIFIMPNADKKYLLDKVPTSFKKTYESLQSNSLTAELFYRDFIKYSSYYSIDEYLCIFYSADIICKLAKISTADVLDYVKSYLRFLSERQKSILYNNGLNSYQIVAVSLLIKEGLTTLNLFTSYIPAICKEYLKVSHKHNMQNKLETCSLYAYSDVTKDSKGNILTIVVDTDIVFKNQLRKLISTKLPYCLFSEDRKRFITLDASNNLAEYSAISMRRLGGIV